MAEDFIQVAPDSTGKRLRGRARTVGSNTVYEQYVRALTSDRVNITTCYVATFRTPARAATTQTLFALLNGGSNIVAVRRLSAEVDSAVAKAALSPWLRSQRIAAVTGGSGTALTPVVSDTSATALSSGVVATGDASADGTGSGTALAVTTAGAMLWQQVVPRFHTLVGYQATPALQLLPDDSTLNGESPLFLRPGQGIAVRFDAAAALTANDFHFGIKAAFDEFTLP